jgi:sugar phosphate isomerase/epimerase
MYMNLAPGAVGVKLPLAEVLPLAASVGWKSVDLPVGEALQIEAAQGQGSVAALYRRAGLRAGGWGLPLNWREPYDMAALHALDRQASLAAELGATRCYTWVPPGSTERPFRENFEFHIKQLRPVARILEEYGCRIGLEFIGPRTTRDALRYGFIYTAEGMLSLAAMIGDNVGLLYDAWHWYTGLGTLSDLRALRASDIVYVHINDAPAGVAVESQLDLVRRLPGATGVIDLAGFLAALRELGYDGPVTPEPFDSDLAARPAPESIAQTYAALAGVWS